jgi:hypothetical protein
VVRQAARAMLLAASLPGANAAWPFAVLFIHLAAFWSSNLLEIVQEVFGMLRFSAVFANPLRCFCRTGAKLFIYILPKLLT